MCNIIDSNVETYTLTYTHTVSVCVCVGTHSHLSLSSISTEPLFPPACGMWHLHGLMSFADISGSYMKGWYLSLTDVSTCLGLQQVQRIIREALLSCKPGEGWLLIPHMGICRDGCSQRLLSG